MADGDGAVTGESSWWGPDPGDDAPLPPTSSDEPAPWGDAIEWPVAPGDVAADDGFGAPDDVVTALAGPEPLPAAPPLDTDLHFDVPAAPEADLHFDAPPPPADEATEFPLEPLPESIWAAEATSSVPLTLEADAAPAQSIWTDSPSTEGGASPDRRAAVPLAAAPATAVYARAEHQEPGPGGGRFHLRHTNAAMIGGVALVGLVVLGLALSARYRTDVQSTASTPAGATGKILAQGLPVPTLATTTTTVPGAPPSSLAPADAPPPQPDASADAGGGATPAATSAGSGAAPRSTSPGTTAPARSTAPSRDQATGGGGGGPAPAVTSAPPDTAAPAPATTEPTAASLPDLTPSPTTPDTTRPRLTIPDITVPPAPDTSTTLAPDMPSLPSIPRHGHTTTE